MYSLFNSSLFRIITCMSSSIIYNMIRKYLAKDLSPKVMTIGLYVFALCTALVIGGASGKQITQWRSWKAIIFLAITGIAIYMFQYSSAMAAKLGYNMASFRMITSVGYIIILFWIEALIFWEKITIYQVIGCFLGAGSLYFLLQK